MIRTRELGKFVGYQINLMAEDPYYRNVSCIHTWECKTLQELEEILENVEWEASKRNEYLKWILPDQYEYECLEIIEHCENGERYEVSIMNRGVGIGLCKTFYEEKKETFVAVEYRLDYFGGDTTIQGQTVLIPTWVIEGYGGDIERAFEHFVQQKRIHIMSYNPDELLDADGNFVKD